ncbi:MAG: tetratricopeptide repeat protein, partial [Gemmataceae bacterium]|nr:tetratricopeptide repeat protein [Gemmataceae bacterium]
KALPHVEQVLNIYLQTRGPDHLVTLQGLADEVVVLALVGQTTEAANLLRMFDSGMRKRLPQHAPELAEMLALVSAVLPRHGKAEATEQFLRQSLAHFEKAAPDEWPTARVRSLLGGVLLAQKKYEVAEPLLLKGYEGLKRREKDIPRPHAACVLEALDRLIDLYAALDKPDEVQKYRELRTKHPFVAPMPRVQPK